LGGTVLDIADAKKSVASLICPSDVDGLVVIGVDCSLVIPNVLGGEVTSEPATVVVADGAVTTVALADDRQDPHKMVVLVLL